jgi:hypothetical protein
VGGKAGATSTAAQGSGTKKAQKVCALSREHAPARGPRPLTCAPRRRGSPSPRQDGAKAVIHAASCDWDADAPKPAKGKGKLLPHQDLR